MNVSMKQLRAFVAVAEHQSFTRAAAALHSTQSALSLTVKELEEEIGFRLLDRTTRQVVLSESGREFHRLALKLLEEFRNVVQNASDIAMLKRGVVRVGATEATACSLIVPAIAAYREARPGIEVQLVITLASSMFHALRNGEVDYIIGPESLQDAEQGSAVRSEPLFRSPVRAWCAPGHALARKPRIEWEQMLRTDLIIPAMDFSTRMVPAIRQHLGAGVVERSLADAGITRRWVTNITAALSMARAGLGITFAAEYVRPLAEAFGLEGRPLLRPQLDRVVALHARTGRSLSPAAAGFADFFRDHLRRVSREAASGMILLPEEERKARPAAAFGHRPRRTRAGQVG
ncbi:transcriptional regulator, LysR family [Noviherbaspirillum humi]|uniref:Transcriptional regulator, LysR family n=2 Tax=Noviherbaspirillum humi TaxID=1688639 RepID=A0A239F5W6_9BURK|nr:transcriptional regulator, LysR family [Noviherbaspirillum humi]